MHWPRHVKVNVNVSPEQLVQPDFVESVVEALSHSGLDPHRLEIEVTESIFLNDTEVARVALSKVMALGCQVALDDFGTGYSSLGYLRKLQFSTIKVDRSFVQGAAQGSSESLAIVRAVVAMAQSLEMKTTAEGVETDEEAKLVRNMGCDRIQGFYFGRPMTSEDAPGHHGLMGSLVAGRGGGAGGLTLRKITPLRPALSSPLRKSDARRCRHAPRRSRAPGAASCPPHSRFR